MTDAPATPPAPASRAVRRLVVAGVLLVLLVGAVVAAGVVVVRRPLPQVDGTAAVPGLSAEVTVRRDADGAAYLEASTATDLALAQGYVQAQDRFWQMDVARRTASGRLAELLGADAVESDLYARTLGFRDVAEAELPLLAPATRGFLEAFADGVNAYLDDRSGSRLSLEYGALDVAGRAVTPYDWTPADSLAVLTARAWDLDRQGVTDEVSRRLASDAVGAERAAELYPRYALRRREPVVTEGAVVDDVYEQGATRGGTRNPRRAVPFATDGAAAALAAVEAGLARGPVVSGRGEGLGSNAWAVSGDRTTTGAPLLAADPHLAPTSPGAYLTVGLRCAPVTAACPYDVSGLSVPGVPGVVAGQNGRVAWATAHLDADTTDLYLERVRGDQWRRDGSWEQLDVRTETVRVAGADDVDLTVRSTVHGPVLSDVDSALDALASRSPDDDAPGPGEPEVAVSLSWTGLQPARSMDAVLALDRASGWADVRAAAALWQVPAQSVVYADRDGHVGYQAAGRVPVRKSGNGGRLPGRGWRASSDWTGDDVPTAALPSVLDPEGGVVVAANQAVVGRGYPYLLTTEPDPGFRADRARRLLSGGALLDADDVEAVQHDVRDPLADVLLPHLLRVELPAGYASAGQRLLADWDLDQDADSAAAAYYDVVWARLLQTAFDDELTGPARPDGGARWYVVVERLLDRPDDPWWDDVTTDVREGRDDVLRQALLDARDVLTERQAVDTGEWTWGALHVLRRDPGAVADLLPGLRRVLEPSTVGAGGSSGTIAATTWDTREGYAVTSAPAARLVVDLADPDASRWVLLGGASGHARSGRWDDQTDAVLDGEGRPWPVTPEAVAEAAEAVLVLTP
ncbi:MAG: penicillin acylase family protein [Nocardioides sp.]|nr:penicillin acylase family protein [Nocardioides sp.]